MSTKGVTPRTWVGGLAAERREAEASQVKVKPKGARPAADAIEQVPARVVDRLGVAGVPEKVAAKHGAAFAGAAGDVAAIASFGANKLEAWRGRSFQRIVEQFYKALGAALDATPEGARAEVAKSSVAALKALVTKVGTADHLGSAVSASVALFELGVREAARGVLTSSPRELPQAMADASAAVLGLADKLSDRTGLGTALNIYPVLVEQLERTEVKLTPARRRELWAAIEGFVVDAGPKTGFTQDVGAELARALGDAIGGGAPRGVDDVLTRATELFRAPFAVAHQEVLDQLASRRVQGITVKSPGRPDFDVFNAALEVMAKAHPAASEALNRAIFDVRAAAVQLLAVHDPRTQEVNPWPAIASLVERLGPTPRGAELLKWLTGLIPNTSDQNVAQALVHAAAAEKTGELAKRLAFVDVAYAGIRRRTSTIA